MERQPGYYWVKINNKWCAEWFDGKMWEVSETMGYSAPDSVWNEINENRIPDPTEKIYYVTVGGSRISFLSEVSLKEFMRLCGLTTLTLDAPPAETYTL